MEIGDGFQMHIFNMATGTEVEELESWEDLTDEILERNLAKMKTITTTEKPDVDQTATTVLLDSNDIRSRFLNQHSAPAVKILKRPNATQSRLSHAAAGDMSPCVNGETRPQRKSLQQREMEYAEARLRILGQAHCPEEKELTFQERVRQIQNKPTSPSSGTGSEQPAAPVANHITSTLSPQSPVFVSHNHFATATTTILTAPHFVNSAVHQAYSASPYYTVVPHIAIGSTGCLSTVGNTAVLSTVGNTAVLSTVGNTAVLSTTPGCTAAVLSTVGNSVLSTVGNPAVVSAVGSTGTVLAPNHHVFTNKLTARSAQVIRQPRGPDGTRGFQFHQSR